MTTPNYDYVKGPVGLPSALSFKGDTLKINSRETLESRLDSLVHRDKELNDYLATARKKAELIRSLTETVSLEQQLGSIANVTSAELLADTNTAITTIRTLFVLFRESNNQLDIERLERDRKRMSSEIAHIKQKILVQGKTSDNNYSVAEMNEKFSALPIKLECLGGYSTGHQGLFLFRVGEHTLRPLSNSLTGTLPDGRWTRKDIERFYDHGIQRPPLDFWVYFRRGEDRRGLNTLFFHNSEFNLENGVARRSDKTKNTEANHIKTLSTEGKVASGLYKVHPHTYGYHYDTRPNLKGLPIETTNSCMGGFSAPLSKALGDKNFLAFGVVLMNYLQTVDLNDGWAYSALRMFNPSEINNPEEEVVKPVWVQPSWKPIFVYGPDTGVVTFLNVPDTEDGNAFVGTAVVVYTDLDGSQDETTIEFSTATELNVLSHIKQGSKPHLLTITAHNGERTRMVL